MAAAIEQANLAPAEEPALWAAARAGQRPARERLIEAYLPFVRVMAAKVYAGRIDSDLEFNEYLQFGTIGLIESVDRFDPALGIGFKTFAAHRINGAILSGLETLSEKRVQISTRKRLQIERRDSARAALADSGTKDLFQQLAEVAIGLALGYILDNPVTYQHEDATVAEHQYAGLEMEQLRHRMQGLIGTLPQRERMVIKYHYLNQFPFTQIADTMGITKGRVSQLHRSALDLLRASMRAVSACDVAW
jgi:RNA polymerase sigma factor for flagellar operon FliA